MLINGQEVPNNLDYNSLLGEVLKAPSAFPGTNSPGPVYTPTPPEVSKLTNEGTFLSADLNPNKNLPLALDNFYKAERAFSDPQAGISFPNPNDLDAIYTNIMLINYGLGNFQEVEKYINLKSKLLSDNKLYFQTEAHFKGMANFAQETNSLDQKRIFYENQLQNNTDHGEKVAANLALGAIYKLEGNHKQSIEHYSEAYALKQGTIDYDAYRVEQHEVGISNSEKIGTDNVRNCVTVVLYDPVTKKSAMTHIDQDTYETEITKIINQHFYDTKEIQTFLVGASSLSAGYGEESSKLNIQRILTELQTHPNVDIKKVNLLNSNSPSGIIFDPQTGQLSEGVPGKIDKSTYTRQVLLHSNLQTKNPNLYQAFDLTQSKEILVPQLTRAQMRSRLERYIQYNSSDSESRKANLIYNHNEKYFAEVIKKDPAIIIEYAAEKMDIGFKSSFFR